MRIWTEIELAQNLDPTTYEFASYLDDCIVVTYIIDTA